MGCLSLLILKMAVISLSLLVRNGSLFIFVYFQLCVLNMVDLYLDKNEQILAHSHANYRNVSVLNHTLTICNEYDDVLLQTADCIKLPDFC